MNDQSSRPGPPCGCGGYLLSRLIVVCKKKSIPALSRFVAEDFKPMSPTTMNLLQDI